MCEPLILQPNTILNCNQSSDILCRMNRGVYRDILTIPPGDLAHTTLSYIVNTLTAELEHFYTNTTANCFDKRISSCYFQMSTCSPSRYRRVSGVRV